MMKKIFYLFLILVFCAGMIGAYALYNFGAGPSKEDKTRYAKLPYYKDGKFQSPKKLGYHKDKVRNGPNGFWRFIDNSRFAPKSPLPMTELNKESFPIEPEDYAVYWLGHSSIIMDVDGKRFIIDPVLDNAGPLPFITPRYSKAPIKREDLPKADYIILTHNHYDHMERETLQSIKDGHFIVPLGLKNALVCWGIDKDRITEIGWGESFEEDFFKITAVEGVHYSSRTPWDRDTTLWNSYAIKTPTKNIFMSGDTGYSDHLAEIGKKYGPFDFAAIEIDGWNPGWPQTHVFPNEAVMMAMDLRAKHVLPTHWAVFELALHPWTESIEMVIDNAKGTNIEIMTPMMGEKLIPATTPTKHWWKDLK